MPATRLPCGGRVVGTGETYERESKMRVTMKESRRSAPDGVNVVFLDAGESYELPDELAASYLERGIAAAESAKVEVVEESKPAEDEPDLDDKDDGGAEESKPAPRPRRRRAP